MYLDLRERKWQEHTEDCIMRSFIIFTPNHIFSGQLGVPSRYVFKGLIRKPEGKKGTIFWM
jgi:hypothetical protein